MVTITEIARTCFACPSQWEGKAESGYIYIRFRHGHLDVRFGSTVKGAVTGQTIFEWHDTDESNGLMEYDELRRITAGVLVLPDTEIDKASDGSAFSCLQGKIRMFVRKDTAVFLSVSRGV